MSNSVRRVDSELLLGLLGLQNGFYTHRQLLAAFSIWAIDRYQSLAALLVEQGALSAEKRSLLEALVPAHLAQHGNDPEQSLRSLSSMDSIRSQLLQLGEPELQANLSLVGARIKPFEKTGVDPDATVVRSSEEQLAAGGRFVVVRFLAQGGLGSVSVAKDLELNRQVAFKQILPRHADSDEARVRFKREAEITGGLEHPGIVPVYGLGTYDNGRPFYSMKLIRGDSLKHALAEFHTRRKAGEVGFDSLEFRNLLQRMIDVCNAMQYAHDRGVLHRDLKPGNIMLGKYGETLVVDWGLAKPLAERESASKGPAAPVLETLDRPLKPRTSLSGSGCSDTQTGEALGTPSYMSPEQAQGELDRLGPATDIYALGSTLYTVLTGEAPIEAQDAGEAIRKAASGDWQPPRARVAAIPRSLEAVCLKAMSMRPADRYTTANDLAADLERWLGDEPISGVREHLTARISRFSRKNRTALLTAMAACVVLAIGGITAAFVINHSLSSAILARQDADQQRIAAQELANTNAQLAERESVQRVRLEQAVKESRLSQKRATEEFQKADLARQIAEIAEKQTLKAIEKSDSLASEMAILAKKEKGEREKAERLNRENMALAEKERSEREKAEQLAKEKSELAAKEESLRKAAQTLADEKAAIAASEMIARKVAQQLAEEMKLANGKLKSANERLDHLNTELANALEENRKQALRTEEQFYTSLYARDLRDIQLLLKSGQQAELSEILAEIPEPLRGWEWDLFANRIDSGKLAANASPIASLMGRETAAELASFTLRGTSGQVFSLAFSPDGKILASGGDDRTVRLWDRVAGKLVRSLVGHEKTVRCVAFHPSKSLLASASLDGTVRIWNTESGAELRSLGSRPTQYFSVAYSPNGRWIVASGGAHEKDDDPWNSTAVVWDAETYEVKTEIAGHTDLIRKVLFSPDSQSLVTGSYDKSLVVRSGDLFEQTKLLNEHGIPVLDAAFSDDGRQLFSVSGGTRENGKQQIGGIRMWTLPEGTNPVGMKGHISTCYSVTYLANGKRIATASHDQTVKIWDVDTGQELLTIAAHQRPVRALASHPSGWLASGDEGGVIHLWNGERHSHLRRRLLQVPIPGAPSPAE